jgi:hypothetical protein
MSEPTGLIYRHYKGEEYFILGVGQLSNTEHEGEVVVIYQHVSGEPKGDHKLTRVRTLDGLDGWNTPLPDGTPRFVMVSRNGIDYLDEAAG